MSYCGKNCVECTYRDEISCVGCAMGPGAAGGDCSLAKCCREKGHESCESCGFRLDCGPLRFRHREPEERARREAARQRELSEIAQRLPILRRWLWVLFWMIVPIVAIGVVGMVSEYVPVLEWPAIILEWIYGLAYGIILLKLSSAQPRYKKAGVFYLIVVALNAASLLIPQYNEMSVNAGRVGCRLLAVVFAIMYMYCVMYAHSEALVGIDNDLSYKWENLRKWRMYTLVIIPAFLVLSILELVYLYRSARVCRDTVVERIT